MSHARVLLAAILTAGTLACTPRVPAFELTYSVFPTAEGADIIVDVRNGPTGTVWVGFGLGPGADPGGIDRVHSVEAHRPDGRVLPMQPAGRAGLRVESPGPDWSLSYSLDLRPGPTDDVFYRSSVRTDDYLVLVGSDAWARFFSSSQPLAYAPGNRPSGYVHEAYVNINLPEHQRDWAVVTTARPLAAHSFLLAEHPVGSVFAVGPFRSVTTPGAGNLRLAVHRDWDVLRTQTPRMLGTLAAALRSRIGESPAPAVAMLQPMPEPLLPAGGLRTAGMVREQSMILYASVSPNARGIRERLSQAMAVFFGHELFHLYVPSTIAVTRDLSWLSEGWAMHMGRLTAEDAGWTTSDGSRDRLNEAYMRYLRMGGYRAGSLPAASTGSESQRDLLYLRGELVFRLLAREWQRTHHSGSFERALWERLSQEYRGDAPLDQAQVRDIMESLLSPEIVRRYVEGQAPLTPAALGLAGR